MKKKKNKKVKIIGWEETDKGDGCGNPAGKYFVEFEVEVDGARGTFQVDKNRGRLSNEPYECKGIPNTDAKKVLREFKKRRKNNEDDENFEINA